MSKPKVAFFDFASCEGDQLQVANLEEDLLALLGHVDVVEFREVMTERADSYDIAFIEGSCNRKMDEARLKKIREKSKLVVALGSCAAIGGINCIRNARPLKTVKEEVYGDKAELFEAYEARPIDAVIKVDFKILGCPINKEEFASITKSLLLGQKPFVPNYPVCVECKQSGNICAFERGETCVGPITRAGCKACCVNEGAICWGCRGLIDDPNVNAHHEVLTKYGLSMEDLTNKYNLYFEYYKPKWKCGC